VIVEHVDDRGNAGGSMATTDRSITRTSSLLLVVAVVVILSPSLLDVAGIDLDEAGVKYTSDAVLSLVGIFITARVIDAWSRRRQAALDTRRFAGISTIAFRTLSQTVNDVGRMLLAPVIGGNLYAAAIPGFTPEHHAENLESLRLSNVDPQRQALSGFWDSIDDAKLVADLRVLCADPEFVDRMFRVTAGARRRLQESMADWAPVMVTVPEANEQLEPGWLLADRLVELAESWRSLGIDLAEQRDPAVATERAVGHYRGTILSYRGWLEELQLRAKLPTRGYHRDED
jgi:hypothetical protein